MNRYYASGVGRFLSVDPYRGSASRRNPQSWNRYSYASNDPVNGSDPLGLHTKFRSGSLTCYFDNDEWREGYDCEYEDAYADGGGDPNDTGDTEDGGGGGGGGSGPNQNTPRRSPGAPTGTPGQSPRAPSIPGIPPRTTAPPTNPQPPRTAGPPPSAYEQAKDLTKLFLCGLSPEGAVMGWLEAGAAKGALMGAFFGAVGGAAALGLTAVPGAFFGGVVSGVAGAGGGALFGAGAAAVCSYAGAYETP